MKKWTLEMCNEEAGKYSSKREWLEKTPQSFMIAKKNGWLDECLKHMISLKKPHGYWTEEKCLEEAKKYSTIKEWSDNNRASYVTALKKGLCKELIKKLGWVLKKPTGYWTKERCLEEAKKYKTKTEWFINDRGSYNAARIKGLLKKFKNNKNK